MTTLADVKNSEVIPDYFLNIRDHKGFLLLCVPEDYGHRSKVFTHPKLVDTRWTLNEYKHDMVYGKKWTRHAGRIYMFLMPLTAMEYDIPKEPGYSYIKVKINGAKITLSTSGGSSSGTWTDYTGFSVKTSVNPKHSTLKKIADVAEDPKVFEDMGLELSESMHDADSIRFYVAEFEVRKALASGLKICLDRFLSFNGDHTPRAIRSVNRKRRSVIVEGAWGGVRVKYSQIDWLKTAETNEIKLPEVV